VPTVYRISKARYPVFDGTGASLEGGRWNAPGRVVVYASTCLAGSILEVIAHAGRLGRLPGAHHGARAHVPDDLPVEAVEPGDLVGWAEPDSATARASGDRWLSEARTAVLFVPAVTAQPFGYNVLLNPAHPDFARIEIEAPQAVVWDARLFRA
jgi:RES domain-containing protein